MQNGRIKVIIIKKKKQKSNSGKKKQKKPEINNICNRKSYILIAYISATENAIPIFLIFKINPIKKFTINGFFNNVWFAKFFISFSNSEFILN